jgi:hypothetical protein
MKNWLPINPIKEVQPCCLVAIGRATKRLFRMVGDTVVCPDCSRKWEMGTDDIHLKVTEDKP